MIHKDTQKNPKIKTHRNDHKHKKMENENNENDENEIFELIKTKKSYLKITYLNNNLNLFDNIIKEIKNKLILNPEIFLFGKIYYQHRSVGFFSNNINGYYYSGRLTESIPLTYSLIILLNQINELFNSSYNGILINYYKDGNDYIGSHSDDENVLSNIGVISLSYGATRKFRIRYKDTKEILMDIPVYSGMLIHMGGEFQKEFTHEIPIEKKVHEGRYSFTFREHLR